jgi:multiple sugar transport system ATP-binding protein
VTDLVLDRVSRVHPDGTRALSGLCLHAADGEILVLTGPSGSGKTTTLRVVAGLTRPSEGTVALDGRVVNDVPVEQRDVALISQEHALYPFLTVEGNLRFPLQLRGVARSEIQRRVAAETRVLRLGGLLRRFPSTLSAGHRQAVALGRATARAPRLFLLDEPLSALDARERIRVRRELHDLLKGLGVTTLYVTNDQIEAMTLGDRVAVLREGVLRQVGTSSELLERPVDRFVAGFFGSPGMRFADAVVEEQGGLGWYRVAGQRLRIPAGLPGPLRGLAGRPVVLGARPHQIADARAARGDAPGAVLFATVDRVERLGSDDLVFLPPRFGGLCARFAPGTAPPRGARVELLVDTANVQVFDAATERALWHGRDYHPNW